MMLAPGLVASSPTDRSTAVDNRALVEKLWVDLYNRDFDAVGAAFADDGEYTDMPTPGDDVARGPAQIAGRLRLGLEPLSGISHDIENRAVKRDRQSRYDIRLGRFNYPRKNRGFRLIIKPLKQAAELRPVRQQREQTT